MPAMITIRKNRGDRGDRRENALWFSLCVLCVLGGFFRSVIQAQDQRPVPTAVWAPKPSQTPPYPAGLKPWTKLADLKARHKSDANWHEVIVDDGRLTGEYVAAAPGGKVAKRLHPDTREWFAVVDGEVRVDIEGQPPFTATRGSFDQHSAPDDLRARDDRRQAEPALRRQCRASQDIVPA